MFLGLFVFLLRVSTQSLQKRKVEWTLTFRAKLTFSISALCCSWELFNQSNIPCWQSALRWFGLPEPTRHLHRITVMSAEARREKTQRRLYNLFSFWGKVLHNAAFVCLQASAAQLREALKQAQRPITGWNTWPFLHLTAPLSLPNLSIKSILIMLNKCRDLYSLNYECYNNWGISVQLLLMTPIWWASSGPNLVVKRRFLGFICFFMLLYTKTLWFFLVSALKIIHLSTK